MVIEQSGSAAAADRRLWSDDSAAASDKISEPDDVEEELKRRPAQWLTDSVRHAADRQPVICDASSERTVCDTTKWPSNQSVNVNSTSLRAQPARRQFSVQPADKSTCITAESTDLLAAAAATAGNDYDFSRQPQMSAASSTCILHRLIPCCRLTRAHDTRHQLVSNYTLIKHPL